MNHVTLSPAPVSTPTSALRPGSLVALPDGEVFVVITDAGHALSLRTGEVPYPLVTDLLGSGARRLTPSDTVTITPT